MLRLIREAEIAGEGVERHVADDPGAAGVALEVAAAERELELRRRAARLADHRRHPLAPELVPVAVEEDVVQLLDRLRREELGVGAPEDRLGAARAELEQALEAALGVRDDEVVLGRIGAVVVVEAGVHAAELGQAHRHVAVVEDHGTPNRSRRKVGMPRKCAIGTVKTTPRRRHARARAPSQVPPPARCHPAPDRLARRLVEDRLVGRVLRAAEIPVAFQPREPAADGGEALPST